MASRIEQIIEEIEEYIDGCKYQALSSSKIIVNKDELEELLNELRSKTPEEIKRYQKIISNKEAILADAQAKADAIIAYTHEGNSARNLAGMGPECPILAITDDEKTYHQLGLSWNVFPVLVEGKANIDETIEAGIEKLKKDILEKGDVVVISGGAKILNNSTENQVIKEWIIK